MTQKNKLFISSVLIGSLALLLPGITHAAGLASPSKASVVSPTSGSASSGNPSVATTTYTVTIDAYVDGQKATTDASSANGAAFPMSATWSNVAGSGGTGTYTLSPTGYNSANAYEAVTSPMKAGSRYKTNQVNSWNNNGTPQGNGEVAGKNGAECATGSPFAYDGFTMGTSLADAASKTPVTTSHAMFPSLTQNEYVIIWDVHCLNTTSTSWNPSPGDNATVTSADLTSVSWSAVPDTYGTATYDYEISNSNTKNADGSFASPVYQQNGLTSPSIQTPNTPDGSYYWHIKAVDSLGNRSAWSPEFQLTVSG